MELSDCTGKERKLNLKKKKLYTKCEWVWHFEEGLILSQ